MNTTHKPPAPSAAALRKGLLAALLLTQPLTALCVPVTKMMDVLALGHKAGVLTVSDYEVTKDAIGVKGSIAANFELTGATDMGKQVLTKWFPQGLTYMQTWRFMTDKQQKFFRYADGSDIVGWTSDPPRGGFKLRSDAVEDFGGDKTPWYSNLNPTMTPGGLPPDSFGADKQFSDTPMVNWGVVNALDGLLNILNGMNGMWIFETALVGVKEKPEAGKEETGLYKVVPLKTFTWGFDFKFMDDGMGGITSDDYVVSAKELSLGTAISDDFKGAFDQKGTGKDREWNVMFVKHVPEPPVPALIAVAVVILWAFRTGLPGPRGDERGLGR